MYFGEFLIKNKIISESDLLEALAFQSESMPSILRLLIEKNKISPHELFDLSSQFRDSFDLVQALIDKKKLSQQEANDFYMEQMSRRLPLGQVLIKKGILTVDQLNSIVGDYFGQRYEHENVAVNLSNASSERVEMNQAALESLRELGMDLGDLGGSTNQTTMNVLDTVIQPPVDVQDINPMLDQFEQVFSEKFKNKIKKLISIMMSENNSNADISNYYNSLFRDLHILKGAIVLASLSSMNTLVSSWEDEIEKALKENNDFMKSWCHKHLKKLDQVIDFLWLARMKVHQDHGESNLLKDAKFLSERESLFYQK